MCATCGCGDADVRLTVDSDLGDPVHGHGHGHGHGRGHGHGPTTHVHLEKDEELRTHTVELEVAVLAKNDGLANQNRAWLARRDITTLNVMSSPGSGKTTLLERSIAALDRQVYVIEGDQETTFDADRIRDAGARVIQVNTGSGCHLDAAMVGQALQALQPAPGGLLLIENVGNLVCPALFDLGESQKVVVISVTEGDDKPLKYPHMFAAADLVVVNKIDLMPYVDFDLKRLTRDARAINPGVEILAVSARTDDNLQSWFDWLDDAG